MIEDSRSNDSRPTGSSMMWFTLGSVACVIFLLCLAQCSARAREMAQRTQCAENMKAIATACVVYGNTNSLSPRTLVCPCSKKTYIVRPSVPRLDARDVLIYEPQGNHGDLAGGNIAYGDGHVVWQTPEQLEVDLAATRSRQSVIAQSPYR